MRHADIPILPVGEALLPDAAADWQAAHTPLMTLRAWLGTDGRTLIDVAWSEDVAELSTMERPLQDMAIAVRAAHRALQHAAIGIVNTFEAREALEHVQGGRN